MQEMLSRLTDWAQRQPEILALYLFGSTASGTDNALSDIDVAVLVQPDLTKAQLWQLERTWVAQLSEVIDFHILNLAPLIFQYEATARGRRLWARDVSQVAEMESLIWRRYWDFRPIFDRNWEGFVNHLLERQDATEREQYQAALAQVRAVHRRVRAESAKRA